MRSGLGLLGMRERVEALGGAFRIESQPARGFRIEASVPFDVGADAVGVP
jgi:signal transduction histidine kinase